MYLVTSLLSTFATQIDDTLMLEISYRKLLLRGWTFAWSFFVGDGAVVATPTNHHGGADDVVSIKVRAIPTRRGVHLTLTLCPGAFLCLLQSTGLCMRILFRGKVFFQHQLTGTILTRPPSYATSYLTEFEEIQSPKSPARFSLSRK